MRAFLLKTNAILISLVWSAEIAQQQQSERALINSPVEGLAGAPHPATLSHPTQEASVLAQTSVKLVDCLYLSVSYPRKPGRELWMGMGRGHLSTHPQPRAEAEWDWTAT